MKVLSINSCGSKVFDKRLWIKETCVSLKVQFLGIQESKMSRFQMFRLRSLRGNPNFDYAVSLSRGYSGGIISLWDPFSFVKSDLWCDDNFVIVKGKWVRKNLQVFMVNVYAPQSLTEKVILWGKISNFMATHPGDYILMGDWNSVRVMDDRCGSEFCPLDARVFNDFILSNALLEIPLGGLQFTWRNKAGNKFSKIDRFFVTNNILIVVDDLKGNADENMVNLRNDLFSERQEINNLEAIDFLQKSRIKWDVEGDENTKFFHASLKYKRASQHIQGLMVDGSWVDDPIAIKDKFYNFFEAKFEECKSGAEFGNINPNYTLSLDEANFLEREVNDAEIKRAVWDCGSSKAPGPDGISFRFIKQFWDIFQFDICRDIPSFFANYSMPCDAKSAFISLIPKVKNPVLITDFGPISLVGFFYKIVTKILTNRLLFVIDKIISPVQSAFISGRQILDGPLMLNEIISWFKKSNRKMLLFQVDFEKAYDSVNWDYLLFMLSSLGFGNKWCAWIKGCLFSAKTSVLVNGSPTREFPIKRGLRQGDPLSPFLFIMVMEGLHLALQRAMETNFIRGVKIGRERIHISHFIYADDVIILSEWNIQELSRILLILKVFHLVSGLQVNVNKSHVFGVGVVSHDVEVYAVAAGARVGSFPTNYLGVPIGANMNRISSWDSLVAKFSSKLASWKASLISSGGRLTLVKSVMGSLGIYLMSLFKCPEKILRKLESIRARFFWGGSDTVKKMPWVKWDKILASFDQGGLNIGSLKAFNIALINKWRWRYLNNSNDLWASIIKSIHGHYFETTDCSSIWSNIVSDCISSTSNGQLTHDAFLLQVGNGSSIKFWHDVWCGSSSLASRYHRLFHLDVNKDDSIADKWYNGEWHWVWSREIIGGRNAQLFNALLDEVNVVQFSVGEDCWKFTINSDGLYTVKAAREHIDRYSLPSNTVPTLWFKFVPRKLNIFLWRFRLNSLPVRWNLSAKGIEINSVVCPVCANGVETMNHLFFGCNFALEVWLKLRLWLDCSMPSFSSWDTFIVWLEGVQLSALNKNRIVAAVITLLWAIWRFRNGVVFNEAFCSKSSIFDQLELGILQIVVQQLKSNLYEVNNHEIDRQFEDLEIYKIVFDSTNVITYFDDKVDDELPQEKKILEESVTYLTGVTDVKEQEELGLECLFEEFDKFEDCKTIIEVNVNFEDLQKEEKNVVSGSDMELLVTSENNKVSRNSDRLSSWRSNSSSNFSSYGSTREEKEWRKTLACKLFEERHNSIGGEEGMDSLWENYNSDNLKNHKKETKINDSYKGGISSFVDDYEDGDEDEDEDDEMEMSNGRLCCLQAIKLSTGKLNLGMKKPNLVKITKVLKGFGWLHHVKKNKHGKKKN
ncbi:uncharacterized protein [Rutidosis leptorrhynchoides]|uniref:uncharacterized protein n=1 Tax=Rutidosis leptorrhynchoides TaxID=125765 RepID=UPI003A99D046